MAADNNALDGYYLVRAYDDGASPFVTVMDLLRENALDIYKKIAPGIMERLPKGYDYLEQRKETESWMRESARANGVNIRKENPLYFVLTGDPDAYAGYALQPMPGSPKRAERKIIVIPASQADLSACSFIYDDSLGKNQRVPEAKTAPGEIPRHPLNGVILNAKQVAEALKIYGEPKTDIPGGFRYLEVQMWDRPAIDVAAAAEVTRPVKLTSGKNSSGRFVYPGKAGPQ